LLGRSLSANNGNTKAKKRAGISRGSVFNMLLHSRMLIFLACGNYSRKGSIMLVRRELQQRACARPGPLTCGLWESMSWRCCSVHLIAEQLSPGGCGAPTRAEPI
jgi:hypothetical protein